MWKSEENSFRKKRGSKQQKVKKNALKYIFKKNGQYKTTMRFSD